MIDDFSQTKTAFHQVWDQGDGPGPIGPCIVMHIDEVKVVTLGSICFIKPNSGYMNNVMGGTEINLQHKGMPALVTKVFWDYETGWIIHGHLIDIEDVRNMDAQLDWSNKPRDEWPEYATEEWIHEQVYGEDKRIEWAKYDPTKIMFYDTDVSLVTTSYSDALALRTNDQVKNLREELTAHLDSLVERVEVIREEFAPEE